MTTKRPKPRAWAHQVKAVDFTRDKPGAMLAMEMGTGKDLDDLTPIPTPEGWTPMGGLQVGQQVFDERGKTCTVLAVYPQGEKPVYDVTFDDGTTIRAGDEHLWITLSHGQRASISRGRDHGENWASMLTPVTTREIRESLANKPGGPREPTHSIPLAMPLDLPETELAIDPYRMGLWLGAGPSGKPVTTQHREDASQHAMTAQSAGGKWTGAAQGLLSTCEETEAEGIKPAGTGDATPWMETIPGGEGTTNKNRIPPKYLRASIAQRTRLLQGIIDSDGYTDPVVTDPGDGRMGFRSTSRAMAEGTLELALSLGHKATMTRGETMTQGETGPGGKHIPEEWQVVFAPAPAALTGQRHIQSIDRAGSAKTTCITVDSPSGLFLAGRRMVPTHNTKCAIDLMEETGARNILVLCPLSVVDHVWPGELERHGPENMTVIPLGERVPNVRAKMHKAAQGLALATARHGQAIIIVNYESAWREPLGSFLKGIHWDLLVMDESHRIKNASGRSSRFASQVADQSKRRLALTGTPMPHSPLDIYAQYRAIDKRVFGVSNQEFKHRYAEYEVVAKPVVTIDEKGNKVTKIPEKVRNFQNLRELNEKFYSLAFRVTAEDTLDLPGAIETYTKISMSDRARKLYNEMAVSFRAQLESGEIVSAANALSRLLRFQQLTSGFAATQDGKILEVDDAKARALADIIEDLPSDEPVVVFAKFQNDLDVIRQTAEKAKPKRPNFEISGRAKQLEEWRQRGGILAVQIQAGGLGLDLTAARYCVYYSLGFSLGDYLQSIARLHRPGQSSLVDYIHLVAADSIDEIIVEALADKEDVINRILETRDLTNGSLGR